MQNMRFVQYFSWNHYEGYVLKYLFSVLGTGKEVVDKSVDRLPVVLRGQRPLETDL